MNAEKAMLLVRQVDGVLITIDFNALPLPTISSSSLAH